MDLLKNNSVLPLVSLMFDCLTTTTLSEKKLAKHALSDVNHLRRQRNNKGTLSYFIVIIADVSSTYSDVLAAYSVAPPS